MESYLNNNNSSTNLSESSISSYNFNQNMSINSNGVQSNNNNYANYYYPTNTDGSAYNYYNFHHYFNYANYPNQFASSSFSLSSPVTKNESFNNQQDQSSDDSKQNEQQETTQSKSNYDYSTSSYCVSSSPSLNNTSSSTSSPTSANNSSISFTKSIPLISNEFNSTPQHYYIKPSIYYQQAPAASNESENSLLFKSNDFQRQYENKSPDDSCINNSKNSILSESDSNSTNNSANQLKSQQTSQTTSRNIKRRSRTQFTKEQIDWLEAIFNKSHYPEVHVVDKLSDKLGLSIERISVWFQNRRAKFKKTKKPSSQQINQPNSLQSSDFELSSLAYNNIYRV